MTPGLQTQLVELIFATDLSCAKVLKPLLFRDLDGTLYEVPAYAPTDFASTPKAVWGFPLFLIPTGWWSIAAIFHDAAFRGLLQIVGPDGARTQAFPAATDMQKANDLFCRIMKSIKPNPTLMETSQLRAIYEGVTLGGWHAWKEDRQA